MDTVFPPVRVVVVAALVATVARAGCAAFPVISTGSGRRSAVINRGDTNTEMVVVDGVAYFSDGAISWMQWVSMPAEGVAMAQAFTPQAVFAAMRAGAQSVEDLGPDDLYGTPTTRYELVVHDPAAAG